MASLSKVIKIGVLCLAYSLVNQMPVCIAQADTVASRINLLEIEEVEVTGKRNPTVFSEVSRMITVIHRDEIEKAGIQSIVDLLEYVSNADVRQRGNSGVQADINIRGGSFDHVMVLVNGINLSDPQTGHFSLDLPIDFEAVAKIEVLEGPAARVLGPGAFTGAINIITRSGISNNPSASLTAGKYGFRRVNVNSEIITGTLHHFLSVSKSTSDGFAHNTDYSINNLYYRGNLQKETSSIDFQGGYQHKFFGAGGFYSPRFPDQYEETDMGFASLKVSTGNTIKVTPQVYWRRKKDHFLLIRDNPAFYENYHLTDVYGSGLNISFGSGHLASVLGFDFRSENIYSNNIGYEHADPKPVAGTDSAYYTKQYGRTNFGLFYEADLKLGRLGITGGTLINWNTGFQSRPSVFPGIDISYKIRHGLTLYTSINRALHLPTFTDLFYVDPINQGNDQLKPNRMMSFEAGGKYRNGPYSGVISGFFYSGKDMIDWLWSYSGNRFSAVNLDHYEGWGVSSDFAIKFNAKLWLGGLNGLSVKYLYLNMNKSLPDSVSKYYHLKHKLSLIIRQKLAKSVFLTWNISYQDRNGETIGFNQANSAYFSIPNKPFWIMDCSLNWHFWKLQLFAEASNIFNTRYIDAGSAIQPGRWLKAGLVVKFQP